MAATIYHGAVSSPETSVSIGTTASGSPSARLREQYLRVVRQLFVAHTWSNEFLRTQSGTDRDTGWLLSVLRRVDIAYEDEPSIGLREGVAYYEDSIDDWDWQ